MCGWRCTSRQWHSCPSSLRRHWCPPSRTHGLRLHRGWAAWAAASCRMHFPPRTAHAGVVCKQLFGTVAMPTCTASFAATRPGGHACATGVTAPRAAACGRRRARVGSRGSVASRCLLARACERSAIACIWGRRSGGTAATRRGTCGVPRPRRRCSQALPRRGRRWRTLCTRRWSQPTAVATAAAAAAAAMAAAAAATTTTVATVATTARMRRGCCRGHHHTRRMQTAARASGCMQALRRSW